MLYTTSCAEAIYWRLSRARSKYRCLRHRHWGSRRGKWPNSIVLTIKSFYTDHHRFKWRLIRRGMQQPRSETSPYILKLRVHLLTPYSPVTYVFPNTSYITHVRCDPGANARTIPSPNFVRQNLWRRLKHLRGRAQYRTTFDRFYI